MHNGNCGQTEFFIFHRTCCTLQWNRGHMFSSGEWLQESMPNYYRYLSVFFVFIFYSFVFNLKVVDNCSVYKFPFSISLKCFKSAIEGFVGLQYVTGSLLRILLFYLLVNICYFHLLLFVVFTSEFQNNKIPYCVCVMNNCTAWGSIVLRFPPKSRISLALHVWWLCIGWSSGLDFSVLEYNTEFFTLSWTS